MMKAVYLAFVLTAACASNESTKHDYVIQGDQCEVYMDSQSCNTQSGCTWYDLGRPCQVGQPCQSGVCSSTAGGGGGGTGGGGTGGGSASCSCFDGGACFEQIGGPAQQSGGQPEIQCGPAYACPGGNIPCDPCASITGQGTCTADPDVGNLCLCDNGIR